MIKILVYRLRGIVRKEMEADGRREGQEGGGVWLPSQVTKEGLNSKAQLTWFTCVLDICVLFAFFSSLILFFFCLKEEHYLTFLIRRSM